MQAGEQTPSGVRRSPGAPRSRTYEPALDGMRALAVAAVILFHSTSILPGGWAGVDTFFVLSGYLITRILVAEVEVRGTVSLKRFYMRRFLRLTPAFACLLSFEVVRALWNPTYREATLKAVTVSAFT